jgi:hypothetical protein
MFHYWEKEAAMSLLPLIQRPCPYIDRLESVMAGDFCRMCKRQVHDLTDMDEAERTAFLAACGGDACVSYRINVRPAIAAALLAASAAALVAPDPALARRHGVSRPHQPPRVPRPPRIEMVPVVTAGLPPPVYQPPQIEPVPPPPEAPPPAPK